MPYLAEDLIPSNQNLQTITAQESVKEALKKMIENEYSQLPVVDDDRKVLGVITSDSILKKIYTLRTSPDDMKVHHASMLVQTHRTDDDIFTVLSYLKEKSIAVIVDKNNQLKGVVSPYDTTQYFRYRAEDMMLIEDVEQSIEDHIMAAFTDENGQVQEELLQQEIDEIVVSPEIHKMTGFLHRYKNASGQEIRVDGDIVFQQVRMKVETKTFDKLTLDQKITLLTRDQQWDAYGQYFDMSKSALLNLLDVVRELRNKLMHFRDEPTKIELEHLRDCVDLLIRKFPPQQPEASKADIVEPSEDEIQEQVEAVEATLKDEVDLVEEESDDYESRYTPLSQYLKAQMNKSEKIRLTFVQIETIISDSLPPSATKHRAWWANDLSHTQAKAWLDAGWRATYVNMSEQIVTFVRNKEQEKKYIDFYSQVLSELRERDFTIRDTASPNGAAWISVANLPVDVDEQPFSMRYHMVVRNKSFRVSLYIDTKNKDTNKQIYDLLLSQREKLEDELQESLTWERMDNRIASRVAIYKENCTIQDYEEALQELSVWAAETMVKFENVMAPYAEKALKQVI